MSMSHINPNSPQTRAWVKYAHKTEGRRMYNEFHEPEEKPEAEPAGNPTIRQKRKYENACDLLSYFSHDRYKRAGTYRKLTSERKHHYLKMLVDIGFLSRGSKDGNSYTYIRTKQGFPTLNEVGRTLKSNKSLAI